VTLRWRATVEVVLLLVSLFFGGNSVLADEGGGLFDKGKTLKRVLKHELVPYRQIMGVARTGQSTSYATGDDGDLQKGIPWPQPRFLDHGNGTVTDNFTGLMWTKGAAEIKGEMNWHNALVACRNLVYAGHQNWRLPNVREMLSLIDFGTHSPALRPGHPFTEVKPTLSFWSGTTSLPNKAQAWCINIMNGVVGRNNKTRSLHHVWAVRGGRHHPW